MQMIESLESNKETTSTPYTPPGIEQVLSREDLEREVHYAGASTSMGDG
jgi:hypothetical protein